MHCHSALREAKLCRLYWRHQHLHLSTPCSFNNGTSAMRPRKPLIFLSRIRSFFPRTCNTLAVLHQLHRIGLHQRHCVPSPAPLLKLSWRCPCSSTGFDRGLLVCNNERRYVPDFPKRDRACIEVGKGRPHAWLALVRSSFTRPCRSYDRQRRELRLRLYCNRTFKLCSATLFRTWAA